MMSTSSPEDIKSEIAAYAMGLGFDQIGFTDSQLPPEARVRLADFLARGYHGDMAWLADRSDERSDPKTLWPDSRSIIALGVNYGPDLNPLEKLKQRETANISVYAQDKDYHDIIKKNLKKLARWMVQSWACEVKVFIDTAPVLEKPLAQKAGLGWQGKHTNLVSREFGSWLFLGEVYTSLSLPPDDSDIDHCGSCQQCLDICPTDAFPAPYRLDARRCISYLTIEHKGPIPVEFRKPMGNRIYGCDDCLAVCPWNKFAQQTDEIRFHTRGALKNPLLTQLAELDDASFRIKFSGSPIKRIGRDRFIRNVLIAIGNSLATDIPPIVEKLLNDDSPLVRGAAVWACGQLNLQQARAMRALHQKDETDQAVLDEWTAIAAP